MSEIDFPVIVGVVIMAAGWLIGHCIGVSARGKELSQDEMKSRTMLKYGFIMCGILVGLIIIGKSAGSW